MTPFFNATDGLAERSFLHLALDGSKMVAQHPMDFHLFRIGEFDDSRGVLVTPETGPKRLGVASEYIQRHRDAQEVNQGINRVPLHNATNDAPEQVSKVQTDITDFTNGNGSS